MQKRYLKKSYDFFGHLFYFNQDKIKLVNKMNIKKNCGIVLIILGLTHRFNGENKFAYPMVIAGTSVVSVIYALDETGLSIGFVTDICKKLPLYSMGFCWVCVAAVMYVISLLAYLS